MNNPEFLDSEHIRGDFDRARGFDPNLDKAPPAKVVNQESSFSHYEAMTARAIGEIIASANDSGANIDFILRVIGENCKNEAENLRHLKGRIALSSRMIISELCDTLKKSVGSPKECDTLSESSEWDRPDREDFL